MTDHDISILDAEPSKKDEEKLPDLSSLMLSASTVPFPRLSEKTLVDRDERLVHIIDNLDRTLLQARANVKAVATTAIKQQQSGKSGRVQAGIGEERIILQNQEILSCMATPPRPDVSYSVKPKPPTATSGADANNSLTSQVNAVVKQYDDYARATLDFYRQALVRRKGEAALPPSKLLATIDQAAKQPSAITPRKASVVGHRRQASSSDIDPTPLKRRVTISEPQSNDATAAVPVPITVSQLGASMLRPKAPVRATTAPVAKVPHMLPAANEVVSAMQLEAVKPPAPPATMLTPAASYPTDIPADQMTVRYRVFKAGESENVRELRISGQVDLMALAQELKKHTGIKSIYIVKDGKIMRPEPGTPRPIKDIIGSTILAVSEVKAAASTPAAANTLTAAVNPATAITSTTPMPSTSVQAQPPGSQPQPSPLVNMTEVNLAADPRRRPALPKLSTEDVIMSDAPASAPAGPISANSAPPGGKVEPVSAAPGPGVKPGFNKGTFVDTARDPRKRR